ncbi:MAG: hypothetical protein OXP75_10795 [Rhodospirillales bacterium]|nr:hypothetical protein [Rhodospirillales bacterium]
MSASRFDKATENLVRWCARDEWLEPQLDIYTAHVAQVADILDVSDDEFEELIGDAADMLGVFILEDFFTARFGEDGELNVVDDYLKRLGWRETAPGRRYLESLRDSMVSLYEVVGINPGRSLTVRDLILGGESVTVHEKLGSKSAAPWDRLAARIVEVNGTMYFTGAVLRFRQELSLQFLSMVDEMAMEREEDITEEARRILAESVDIRSVVREFMLGGGHGAQMFTQTWLLDTLLQAQAPLPALHNTDDEPIVFCRVRFPIVGDEAEIATMLDGIECFARDEGDVPSWTWSVPGSPLHRMALLRRGIEVRKSESMIGTTSLGHAEMEGGALTLFVNSRGRAERGRDLLVSCLGDRVGPPLISYQDPEKALEEDAGQPDREHETEPKEAALVMRACTDEYCRRMLDDPHPSVDGKTLRQAVKTRKGREKAIDWLKQLENTEHRRALQQGDRPYDTSWLWRELGIEVPR